jgi:hypothetical protein
MTNLPYLTEIPDIIEYMESAYTRHQENQLMHRAGIKGRYQYLNLEWSEEILEEAVKRDGGGITAYLRKISEEQIEARRARLEKWGIW